MFHCIYLQIIWRKKGVGHKLLVPNLANQNQNHEVNIYNSYSPSHSPSLIPSPIHTFHTYLPLSFFFPYIFLLFNLPPLNIIFSPTSLFPFPFFAYKSDIPDYIRYLDISWSNFMNWVWYTRLFRIPGYQLV